MAFSMFNFIKALMPKFSQHKPKNDGAFKVQLYYTNVALKMPKWVTKMPKLATKMLKLAIFCLIFVAKKVAFLMTKQFYWSFLANKKCRH